MPEPSPLPGDERCLAGLCAALEASRGDTPERLLVGFAEALMVDVAALLQLAPDGAPARLRAVGRDRRPAIDGELRLPTSWLAGLVDGRLVRASAAELSPGERTALRLAPTAAVLIAAMPASEGPPVAALLLATPLAPATWSLGQEQALRGLAAGLAGWHAARRGQQILDHLPQRIAWKDPGLRYRGANRAFTRAAGLASAQLLGRVDADLPTRADSSELAEAARRQEQRALTTAQLRQLEAVPLAGGREQWFEVSRVPLEGGGLLLVRDDVSARVQLTQHLQLAQRVAAIGRLAAGVGEALGPISGEISAAVAEARSDPTALTRVDLHTRALDDLTRQLAIFAGRQISEPADLMPGQVLARMEPTLVRLLGAHVRLVLAPPTLRCTVRMDPRMFELLLVSAFMHLRARLGISRTSHLSRISVEVAPATLDLAHASELALPVGEYVRLRVLMDPGPAEPDPAHDLRLALARTIAATAGGGVHLACEPAGLRLELHLPRVFTTPRPPEARPVVDLRGAEHLLLLERDPLLAQTLSVVLRHLGYDVLVAADLAGAVDLLDRTCPPDHIPKISLALLSTSLINAGDVPRSLRARWPELRVLWLATSPGAAAPVGDPLVVPCSFEALALRVRQVLEARGA